MDDIMNIADEKMARLLVVFGDEARECRVVDNVPYDITEANAKDLLRNANEGGTIRDMIDEVLLGAGSIPSRFIDTCHLDRSEREIEGPTLVLRPKVVFG